LAFVPFRTVGGGLSPPDPDPDDDEDEEIRDPKAKIKALTEANERLVRKLDKKDARIAELEEAGEGSPDTPTRTRSA
jgi:hypothetical protein